MKKTVNTADRLCLSVRKPARTWGAALVLGTMLLSSPAAHAKDPCKMVMCMWGKFSGDDGGDECDSAEQEYFSILVKKKGKIRWSDTAKERLKQQNSCPTAERGKTKQINDKFGKARG